MHFDFKLNYGNDLNSAFSLDMWGLDSDGNPLDFKSRRKASIRDSLKTWNQLLSSDWRKTKLNDVKIA